MPGLAVRDLVARGQFHHHDAGDDECARREAHRIGGLAEHNNAEQEGADRPDAGPDRIGRSAKLAIIATMVITLGTRMVKPSDFFIE
jgi:hypothetical protein